MRLYIDGKRYKLKPQTLLFLQGIALIALGKLCIVTNATGAAVFFIMYGICAALGKER